MSYKDENKEREYKREWYRRNKERVKSIAVQWAKDNREKRKLIDKKWRENNPDKWLEIQRKCSNRAWLKNKENQLVRAKTYRKYGKLPKGYEYHHTTIPYHIDKFVIVKIIGHHKIHKKGDNNATERL